MAKSGETIAAEVPHFTAHANENWTFTPRGGDLHIENTIKPDALGFRALGGVSFFVHAATARTLLDGLAHACEHVDGTRAPADPELDPILDAVRERRFDAVLAMISEIAPDARRSLRMLPELRLGLLDDGDREITYRGYYRHIILSARHLRDWITFPACTGGSGTAREYAIYCGETIVARGPLVPTIPIGNGITARVRVELDEDVERTLFAAGLRRG